MARLVERALAREVVSTQLSFDIADCDLQSTCDEIVVIATNRLRSAKRQRMWVAPLGRPRHDDDARWEPRSLSP
jgi:hypothetical protein